MLAEKPQLNAFRRAAWCEIGLMLCFLFVYHGSLPPDVNEVHYLTRALQAWSPETYPKDLFATSPGAQGIFVATFGWLTLWTSLPATAWLGRLAAWILVATGWRRLGETFGFSWGWSLLTMAFAAAANQHLHMAGEWFVGGIEAKSIAYGFVLWGLAWLLRGDIGLGLGALGLAGWFHPLVGGWMILCTVPIVLLSQFGSIPRITIPPAGLAESRSNRGLGWGLGLAIGFLILGILPVLGYDRGAQPEARSLAHWIYVYERLPHHLVPHRMRLENILRFACLVVAWTWLATRRRPYPRWSELHGITAMSLILNATGWLWDLSTLNCPRLGAEGLRFYWFRLADVMVPWSVALSIGDGIRSLLVNTTDGEKPPRSKSETWGTIALVVVLVPLVWSSLVRFQGRVVDPRSPADQQGDVAGGDSYADPAQIDADWRELCAWARESTPRDALFLTPFRSQTFRWYALRSEFANWKDMPQNAEGITAWWRRIEALKSLGLNVRGRFVEEEAVAQFAHEEQIDFVVVVLGRHPGLWRLPCPFRNASFAVYATP